MRRIVRHASPGGRRSPLATGAFVIVVLVIAGVFLLPRSPAEGDGTTIVTALHHGEHPPRVALGDEAEGKEAPPDLFPAAGQTYHTDASSLRTVLVFDERTTLRLDKRTTLRLDVVRRSGDRLDVEVALKEGRLWVVVDPAARVRVSTKSATVSPEGAGVEIDAGSSGTTITAWKGVARLQTAADPKGRGLTTGTLTFASADGPIVTANIPAGERDLWQTWNLRNAPEVIASGWLPPVPSRPSQGPKAVVATRPPPPRPAPKKPKPVGLPRQTADARPALPPGTYTNEEALRLGPDSRTLPQGTLPPAPRPTTPRAAPEAALSNLSRETQRTSSETTDDIAAPRPFEIPDSLTRRGLPDVTSMINSASYVQEPHVHSATRARQIWDQVVRDLTRQFNLRCSLPVHFQMVNSDDYRSEGGSAMTEGVMGLCRSTQDEHKVFVLEGLAGDEFFAVCAHEYAHAWAQERACGKMRGSSVAMEGFATWVEYKYYILHGAASEAVVFVDPNAELSRPEAYVKGLRGFLDLERRSGEYGVFRYVTTGRSH